MFLYYYAYAVERIKISASARHWTLIHQSPSLQPNNYTDWAILVSYDAPTNKKPYTNTDPSESFTPLLLITSSDPMTFSHLLPITTAYVSLSPVFQTQAGAMHTQSWNTSNTFTKNCQSLQKNPDLLRCCLGRLGTASGFPTNAPRSAIRYAKWRRRWVSITISLSEAATLNET